MIMQNFLTQLLEFLYEKKLSLSSFLNLLSRYLNSPGLNLS